MDTSSDEQEMSSRDVVVALDEDQNFIPRKSIEKFYSKPREWQNKINTFVAKLDEKVKIDKNDDRYKEIYEGRSRIAKAVCRELSKACCCKYAGILCESTGSANAGTKVGFPHEEDFILKVNHGWRRVFCCLCNASDEDDLEIFSAMVEELFIQGRLNIDPHWTVHGVHWHKAGVCLVMEYKKDISNLDIGVGVTIDLVPVKRASLWNRFEFFGTQTMESHRFLQSMNLDHILNPKIFRLLGRDKNDTGTIENEILASLDEDIKRAFRVAKFVLQHYVKQEDHTAQYPSVDIDEYRSLKLYGLSPGWKSYYLRKCLLHLLISTHGTDLAPLLKDGALVLCLFDMLPCLALPVGDDEARLLNCKDPIKGMDDAVFPTQYSIELEVLVDYMKEDFIESALSDSLDDYTLLNTERFFES